MEIVEQIKRMADLVERLQEHGITSIEYIDASTYGHNSLFLSGTTPEQMDTLESLMSGKKYKHHDGLHVVDGWIDGVCVHAFARMGEVRPNRPDPLPMGVKEAEAAANTERTE